MRLYTFEIEGRRTIGAEWNHRLLDLNAAHEAVAPETLAQRIPRDMLTFIQGGERMLDAARETLRAADSRFSYSLDDVRLCAPLSRPGKILCSGLNYRSHIQENPKAVFPEEPDVFSKVPSVVIGPGDPIVIPPMSKQVDYEVEFAVVIGTVMKHTPLEQVMGHIFGYTILHDVSARDVQFKPNGRTRGKNFDTFAPLGPCIVTVDELTAPDNCYLRSYLNGQVMQDGTTRDWLFPLPVFLNYLSSIMTLEPGDILSTGTPAGVGYFKKPQVFLKPGDICVLEIEYIGRLENPVIAYSEQR
ncbi:MAG TPA: fumarylacetoacetate hydrolase family protein [Anaerolineae bacterium]|nr:fumarylacetoacetate hydrolase family protein [Anaerolineae bacterium]